SDLGNPMTGGAGALHEPDAPPPATAAAGQDNLASRAPTAPKTVRSDFRDTAFWTAGITTGADGSAIVPVPLPDNLTTWRLTARGVTAGVPAAGPLAGMTTSPLTVTQPLLLRPVQ